MDNQVETADSYLNLASCNLKQNRLKEAKVLLDTAFSLALRFDYFEAMLAGRLLYANYYEKQNDFKNAFLWQKTFYRIKDSLLNTGNNLLNENNLEPVPAFAAKNFRRLNNVPLIWLLLCISVLAPFYIYRRKR